MKFNLFFYKNNEIINLIIKFKFNMKIKLV